MSSQHSCAKKNQVKQIYNIDVESLINLPGKVHVYWKDLNCLYLGCNDLSAEKSGVSSRDKIVNISDYDIPYNVADIAIQQDKEVMASREVKYYFDTAVYNQDLIIDYFSIKSPLFDINNKLAGVIGISYYLAERDNDKTFQKLHDAGILINHAIPGQTNTTISFAHKNIRFPRRQAECLFYLINGMTSKQIGNSMGVSYRTVERYIDILKAKLQCNTKSSLVAEGLKMDFIKEWLIAGKISIF